MYFIGVDLGTSEIKARIVNDVGELISSSYWETNLISSAPGRIEQDPEDFYVGTWNNQRYFGKIKNFF